jgi:DNA-binding XRE family transcriptional regulator
MLCEWQDIHWAQLFARYSGIMGVGGDSMPRVPKQLDSETLTVIAQLGTLIKLHRIKQRMTQQELAERAKLTADQIVRYESGAVDPPLSSIIKIARAMGYTKLKQLLEHEAIEV